jgi:hypothetical protein
MGAGSDESLSPALKSEQPDATRSRTNVADRTADFAVLIGKMVA